MSDKISNSIFLPNFFKFAKEKKDEEPKYKTAKKDKLNPRRTPSPFHTPTFGKKKEKKIWTKIK